MKIIAGLGNPGAEYAKTKHNVGFMFIDALADALGLSASDWKDKFEAKVADARIGTEKVVLVKPQTYMNESGRAVGPLMNWYKLDPEDLIVVHDDMDIPAGTIRIRKKGSAGGHNGIKNIILHLGHDTFQRIKIGVGEKPKGYDLADYVLGHFSGEELAIMKESLEKVCGAVELMLEGDVDAAMNQYNKKAD